MIFSNQCFFTCRWYHQELCKVNRAQSQNLSPSLQVQKRYRIKLLFYHISLICWSQITVNVVKLFFLHIMMLLIFVYTYFKQVTCYKITFASCIIFLMQDNSEMTALQEKLSQTNNKVAEFRNQCEKLKKDLKVAHKVSFFF